MTVVRGKILTLQIFSTNFCVPQLLVTDFGRLIVEDHRSHADSSGICHLALSLGGWMSLPFSHFPSGETGNDIHRLRY